MQGLVFSISNIIFRVHIQLHMQNQWGLSHFNMSTPPFNYHRFQIKDQSKSQDTNWSSQYYNHESIYKYVDLLYNKNQYILCTLYKKQVHILA